MSFKDNLTADIQNPCPCYTRCKCTACSWRDKYENFVKKLKESEEEMIDIYENRLKFSREFAEKKDDKNGKM